MLVKLDFSKSSVAQSQSGAGEKYNPIFIYLRMRPVRSVYNSIPTPLEFLCSILEVIPDFH